MRQDVELSSFSKGELSPRLKGRTDFEGYFNGCDTLLNMVVLQQGGATRRPGTVYSALTKSQTLDAKLIRFQFSVTQAYMLEFGNLYMRVYKDDFPVLNALTITGAANNGVGLIRLTVASTAGLYSLNTATVANVGGVPNATGTWIITVISATTFDLVGSTFAGLYTAGGTASVIVEVPTPWSDTQVFDLGHTQSADRLYLAHPLIQPRTITRTAHTNWVISLFASEDGPYLSANRTATTLTLGAVAGATTITASGIVGINGDTGFAATDVGRIVRFAGAAVFAWLKITAFTSTVVVNATVQAAIPNGATTPADAIGPSTTWALGAWGDTTGWPWLVSFFQQRLMFAGTNNQPGRVDGSQINDFTNFAPSKSDGTVLDTSAVSWIIANDEVNAPRWMSSAGSATTPQLAIGNDGAEEVLQAGGSAQALTPTSVQAYRETNIGAHQGSAVVKVNKAILFAGFAGRKIHEWKFTWQTNGYEGADLAVLSEHLTRTGIHDIAFQKRPNGVVWMIRHDGNLVGMTYLQEQSITGWHQHTLGGDYYGGPPVVISIATMPSTDNLYDELWLIVKRTINGSVVRTVEVMDKYFDAQPQDQAVFMDLSVKSTLIYPAATLSVDSMVVSTDAAPVTVTFTATAGTPFLITDIGSIVRFNSGVGYITGFTSSTVLTGRWYRAPTSREPQTVNNWSMTPQYASFSGLTVHEGQTVQILGDGADFGTATVASQAVTLDTSKGSASYAVIGLPIFYRLVTMPWSPKQAATAQGHYKTITTLFLRMLESLGCDYGRKATDEYSNAVSYVVDTLETRAATDLVGAPPPLYSGITRLPMPGGADMEGQIVIQGQGPYPTTILSLSADADVGELPGGG